MIFLKLNTVKRYQNCVLTPKRYPILSMWESPCYIWHSRHAVCDRVYLYYIVPFAYFACLSCYTNF